MILISEIQEMIKTSVYEATFTIGAAYFILHTIQDK
jgi:hypothetical protein